MKKQDYLNNLKTHRILREQKVKIPVEHPGVLEVPEGQNVEDLPESHFKALIAKKGWAEISRALTNLHTWNKEKNPSLSAWANKMQETLGKDEVKESETLEEFGPRPGAAADRLDARQGLMTGSIGGLFSRSPERKAKVARIKQKAKQKAFPLWQKREKEKAKTQGKSS